MDYEKKYKEALEIARKINSGEGVAAPPDWTSYEVIFPELKESEDERIKCEIRVILENTDFSQFALDYTFADMIAWLEKQVGYVLDCPKNHQDSNYPNGCIVLEDFNGGEGFYKVHLDYLNKKQVEEVEEMIRAWNTELKTPNETIKACIGMALTDVPETRFKSYGVSLKECLDWLEKQGKETSYKLSKEDDVRRRSTIQVLEYARSLDVYNQYGKADIDKNIAWLEKLGNKPQGKTALEAIKEEKVDNANKVEPKFKVGNWIANGGATPCYVKSIFGDYYKLCSCEGFEYTKHIKDVDNYYHLWTILNAKDGDVLLSKHNQPFIYNGTFNDESVGAYCGIDCLGSAFIEATLPCSWTPKQGVKPATKEQRELLFEKMREAGYEWDFDEKELKKIEQ